MGEANFYYFTCLSHFVLNSLKMPPPEDELSGDELEKGENEGDEPQDGINEDSNEGDSKEGRGKKRKRKKKEDDGMAELDELLGAEDKKDKKERKEKNKKKKKKKSEDPDSPPAHPQDDQEADGTMEESDFVGGSDQELNDSDYVAEPKEKKARKSAPTATPKGGDKKSPDQQTAEEVVEKYGLVNVELEYEDEDFKTFTNFKIFCANIKPLIAEQNPKLVMSKMQPLLGAKWREFQALKAERGMDGAADNGTASDAEKDAEELAEEEEEEEEGGKRKASKKKKTVAPLKIKIGAKGTPGAGGKKRKKKKTAEDDPDMSNDSDAEFEAMLEEAAVQSQNGSDSNGPSTPAPATPKGCSKSKKGAATKGGKNTRAGGSSKGGKPKTKTTSAFPNDPDAEGYDTDHQDYCEVCQQGGEVILCDTCPRAYHLVCLDPELDEAPEGKWSCPHCEQNGADDKEEEEDDHMEYCKACGDGGELLTCDSCPVAYHSFCVYPPLWEVPDSDWHCGKCSFSQLKGKVQKILTWRWQEPPVEDEEEKKEREERRKKEDEEYESMSEDEKKKLDAWRNKQKELDEGRENNGTPKMREFFIKWHEMSYWHCSWVLETGLDVYHPALLRNYQRKYDMDEIPQLDEDLEFSRKGKKHMDKHQLLLDERFYQYGIRPEWLSVHRIINHRTVKDGTTWYLVKWRELGYDQATWETEDDDELDIRITDFSRFIEEYWKLRAFMGIDSTPAKPSKKDKKKDKKSKKKNKKKKGVIDESDDEDDDGDSYVCAGPPDVPVTDLRKKWEEQPDYIDKTGGRLHEYQKEGVNWLRFN